MYELTVENMTCGHCVSAVTEAVHTVDPAAFVEVDLKGRHVKVNSTAALEPIKAAIEDAGYPVTRAAA
ncbi:copper chaperone [Pseudoduganella eburnea]|jgi:copper chaperone|uniref:Copper chaperone n=1 Tax=Massilia eburnea TaxID=1776165 RepID=A0A6L6QIQ2_9BURK|nr:heavy-metal-associated domain-containing protein [Massilia eburnea]MTW11513.1 copper chaperone [Massilia eburnea]